MTVPAGGRWNDLQTRVVSAAVMVAVGGGGVWLGGQPFAVLVIALTGLMIWELAAMVRPQSGRESIYLGLITGFALLAVLNHPSPLAPLLLMTVPAAMLYPAVIGRFAFASYAALIVISGYCLVTLRDTFGIAAILWVIGVVIASDVLGYFAGRSLGGPKFWPAISPKKTWSGTVAGWAGAALVGLGFFLVTDAGWGLVILSPIVAFAGQMGDIAESWIKRRTGVKDSSNLIPGHGGVLDRFDALIGAVVVVMVLGLLLPLPLPTGN